MLALARPNVTPPGGYWYHDPDLNVDIKEDLLAKVILKATRLRQINSLHISENFAAEIENQICQKLPQALVVFVDSGESLSSPDVDSSSVFPQSPSGRPPVTESGALRVTVALLRRARRFLPWDDAALRVPLCVGCPENVQEPCCYGCRIGSVFAQFSGKLPQGKTFTPVGVCHSDKTFTKAVIRVIDVDMFEGEYPEHCWKRVPESEETTTDED